MFLAIAVILTIIFVVFFLAFINSGEDEHKGWTVFLVLLGIAATIFWFLEAYHWDKGLSEEQIVLTKAISGVTGEDKDDIASLVLLCEGDSTIAEMLQAMDMEITEEEAKNFESIILRQLQSED